MRDYSEIELKQILRFLWRKAWLIALVITIAGTAAFLVTRFLIVPQYTASIKMYVNNSTEANKVISSSDLSAAQSLVGTYITIIRSDIVLDEVSTHTGLPYSAGEINGMITAGAINNTEVFLVSVTNPDPEAATEIANAIAETASDKIREIIGGSSVKIVDYAKVPSTPSTPDCLRNTALGGLIGLVLIVGLLLLLEVTDTRIKTESDLENVSGLPVLGALSEFGFSEKAGGTKYSRVAGRERKA